MKKKPLSVVFLAFMVVTVAGAQSTREADYDWIRNARIFIIDGYSYPLSPKIEFDARTLAETMVDMHANVVRIATSGNFGWLIPANEFKVHPDLGSRDILGETIAACKPRGIKVVPYVSTGNTINASLINPEWAQKTTPDGDIVTNWDMGAKTTPCCWNTPYRQAFYNLVRTIVSQYDVAGIYFDAWLPFYFFGGKEMICYCKGCTSGFRAARGRELPYKKNEDYSPDEVRTLDLYRSWYREELFSVFSETKRIVKSYKNIPLIYNINNPRRIMNEDFRIVQGSDAFLYERGGSLIERAEGVSLATAHGLAVWPYVGTYDPFPRIPHYQYELEQEIFTSVAFGGSPILYHTYFFTAHPEARAPIKEAFGIIDKNNDAIRGFSPAKFCAVVWNNSDPPGHASDGWLWDTNARLSSLGSFSACVNSHIQTTSLLPQDLDTLDLISKYKVLFLADICYLTDKQLTTISRFVENGGGLVMTNATSLYNEHGEKRTDFALGQLAKIRYRKPDERLSEKVAQHLEFGSVFDMYLKARPGQSVIKHPLADGLLPTHLYETVDVIPGGSVVADIVIGTDNEPVVPGLVMSRYGKGKVAYLAAEVGAMYLQSGIRELSDLIRDVIDYVSPDGAPYEIEAPTGSLITNMTTKEDKMVFHLINRTGNNQERMWQNVYAIPPIENVTIKVRIPDGKKIKSITPFLSVAFLQRQENNILLITLPRVQKYQGIVIELIQK